MIDKKFVIHVVTELMVFIGIIYFVKKKSSENDERISELEKKVSVLIQEIDNQRKYISMMCSSNMQNNQVCQVPIQTLTPKQPVIQREVEQVVQQENKEVPFEEFVSVSVSDTFEEVSNEQDIDNEIQEELQELENN